MTKFRLAILVAPALTLAACGGHEETPVLATPIGRRVPDEMLHCLPEPGADSVRTDQDAARWVTDLALAGRDCRGKLGFARSALQGER